jgi:hypothetical protein
VGEIGGRKKERFNAEDDAETLSSQRRKKRDAGDVLLFGGAYKNYIVNFGRPWIVFVHPS